MVGCISGRARLDTFRSFCMKLLNFLRLGSGRGRALGSVSKHEADAGVVGVTVGPTSLRTNKYILYMFIYCISGKQQQSTIAGCGPANGHYNCKIQEKQTTD